MTGAERQVLLLRAAFAGLVVLGVAALLGLCWVLAGRAMAPVEASQRRQAEFVAAASHELRAPLAVIRTSASALRVEPERANALTDGIERECARMARLVEDLLSLAGMDAGTWSIRRERVDLDTLLLETADDFYPIARRKGQTLALEVPDEPLPSVTGDPQRLRQILSVLLDNACSYTPEGGTITLSGAAEGRWACLRTADTGPGIGPEHLPHIFDRFYRADAARTGKGHFGLGLSIARELARLHGGELSVERTGSGHRVFAPPAPVKEERERRAALQRGVFECLSAEKLHKSGAELVPVAHDEDDEHQKGQHIAEIGTEPGGEADALAGVRLGQEVVPAPAVLGDAEEQVHQAAQGEQVVGEDEVLQVHDHGAVAQGIEAATTG